MLRRLAQRLATKVGSGATRRPPPPPAKNRATRFGGSSAPADVRPGGRVNVDHEAPVADGEALATIEAGCQEVKERVECGEPVVLLDVRQPEETALGTIEGAILIPLPELEARWEEVKDCNEIVCYCAKGGRSLQAATFLRTKGVFNATSLEGGVTEWTRLGGELLPSPAK